MEEPSSGAGNESGGRGKPPVFKKWEPERDKPSGKWRVTTSVSRLKWAARKGQRGQPEKGGIQEEWGSEYGQAG